MECPPVSHLVECSTPGGGITHHDDSPKTSVTFNWVAPVSDIAKDAVTGVSQMNFYTVVVEQIDQFYLFDTVTAEVPPSAAWNAWNTANTAGITYPQNVEVVRGEAASFKPVNPCTIAGGVYNSIAIPSGFTLNPQTGVLSSDKVTAFSGTHTVPLRYTVSSGADVGADNGVIKFVVVEPAPTSIAYGDAKLTAYTKQTGK